jgi:DNA-binding transcriptional LysR family regulator
MRLSVPRIAVPLVQPVLPRLLRAHPRLSVEVSVDDRLVDIVAERYDAGIRLSESIERDMVSVRICPPFRFVVVGSPEYLARRGRPRHPRELVEHQTCASTTDIHRTRGEGRRQRAETAARAGHSALSASSAARARKSPARASPSAIASGVSATARQRILPEHSGHTVTSIANTCRRSHAHGRERFREAVPRARHEHPQPERRRAEEWLGAR